MSDLLIEKAFVISLRDNSERLENFFKNLPETSWMPRPEVWYAIKGDTCAPPSHWHAGNGAWGCMRSHVNILEHCLNNRICSYIVFEDDAQFDEKWEASETYMRSLPDDWQLAYLGGQLMHAKTHRPEWINDHVLRPYNVNRTHCFAVSRKGMLPIYQHCCRLPYEKSFHIDHHLGRWHEDARNRVYCPSKWLVGQHGFPSSISGREEGITFYKNPEAYAKKPTGRAAVCILYRANPVFINEATSILHFGYQVDDKGYDPSLAAAADSKTPHRLINCWWGYVDRESISTKRLPAMYHPEIDEGTMREALPGVEFITIEHVSSIEDLKKQIESVK